MRSLSVAFTDIITILYFGIGQSRSVTSRASTRGERAEENMSTPVAPWVRIFILLSGMTTIGLLSYFLTGEVLPSDSKYAMVFQNALLLVILGSTVLEHHFTKPTDSLVNSLMGLLTLISVYGVAPRGPWFLIAGYCSLVFVLSGTCVAVSTGTDMAGWRRLVADLTRRPAVVLGKSRILFTVVFLSGLWFFYSTQDRLTLVLVLFWGIFLAIWPLNIPQLLTSIFGSPSHSPAVVGRIVRIDSPNIVRVGLAEAAPWEDTGPKHCTLSNGEAFWVQPLYAHLQEGRVLGTGLLTSISAKGDSRNKNCIVDACGDSVPPAEDINEALGGGQNSRLVGFVVEGSGVRAIRFQALSSTCCHDGMLVWARVDRSRVYYQVVSGETQEESFETDKHGFQIATAVQLGVLIQDRGFAKNDWLPAMNAPVFSASPGQQLAIDTTQAGDFVLGMVPKSRVKVGGNFTAHYNSHTAILGVTGSGKTELAFDLVGHAVRNGIKVVCIDLTNQYQDRLAALTPIDLSLGDGITRQLSQKLFEVETGAYNAGREKVALEQYAEAVRNSVVDSVRNFLSSAAESNVGVIRLEEISNTKATLWITELFMTCLLNYARAQMASCPPVLIVVEEAHTVMPEPNTMGVGDYDSKALVSKIAQIALQGRKYGIGLLVLAQRTATVSKTVLTQCNTIISFACYDETSLSFLRTIFGPEQIAQIPSLPRLHAIAFGTWIRSEQPLVFEVPFDESKAQLGRRRTGASAPNHLS